MSVMSQTHAEAALELRLALADLQDEFIKALKEDWHWFVSIWVIVVVLWLANTVAPLL